MQLVASTMVGVGLLIVGYLALRFVPQLNSYGHAPGWAGVLRRVVIICAMLSPFFVWYLRAASLLRSGVRENRWTEEQLDVARAFAQRRVWKVMMGFQLVLFFMFAIFDRGHSLWMVFYWVVFIPLQIPRLLRDSLRHTAPMSSSKLIDWSTFKPMQSDHWGTPKAR